MQQADIGVWVAPPQRVRYFAKAQGRLAKTDQIDAALLADYGRYAKLSQVHIDLAVTLERREALIGFIVAEQNRLKQTWCPEMRRDIQSLLRLLMARKSLFTIFSGRGWHCQNSALCLANRSRPSQDWPPSTAIAVPSTAGVSSGGQIQPAARHSPRNPNRLSRLGVRLQKCVRPPGTPFSPAPR